MYCSVVLAAHHYYAVVQSKTLGGRADSSGSGTIVSLILNFDVVDDDIRKGRRKRGRRAHHAFHVERSREAWKKENGGRMRDKKTGDISNPQRKVVLTSSDGAKSRKRRIC